MAIHSDRKTTVGLLGINSRSYWWTPSCIFFLTDITTVMPYNFCFLADKNIEEMIARGRRVRCLWVYAPESESCSAFSGILWELQKKVRQFHQSAETFWLHNGTIVNRDLVEFSKWKPPMPLP